MLRNLLFLFLLSFPAQAEIPSTPAPEIFVHDFGNLLDPDAKANIQRMVVDEFRKTNVPIVLVTINSIADYSNHTSIEGLATEWFNKWGIGTQGHNSGILVILSRYDRRVRIELGAAWGQLWDAHCKKIIENKILPHFKKENYRLGIVEGVSALIEMSKDGPRMVPPRPSKIEKFKDYKTKAVNTHLTGLSSNMLNAAFWLGVILTVSAFFIPQHKKHLLIVGIGLIVFVLLFQIVLVIVAIFLKSRGRSKGGGFGGGSSRGGGASGGW